MCFLAALKPGSGDGCDFAQQQENPVAQQCPKGVEDHIVDVTLPHEEELSALHKNGNAAAHQYGSPPSVVSEQQGREEPQRQENQHISNKIDDNIQEIMPAEIISVDPEHTEGNEIQILPKLRLFRQRCAPANGWSQGYSQNTAH